MPATTMKKVIIMLESIGRNKPDVKISTIRSLIKFHVTLSQRQANEIYRSLQEMEILISSKKSGCMRINWEMLDSYIERDKQLRKSYGIINE